MTYDMCFMYAARQYQVLRCEDRLQYSAFS